MKRVLVLDVAYTNIGWAVIEPYRDKAVVIAVGSVKNPSDPKKKKQNVRVSSVTAERIAKLYRDLRAVYLEWLPDGAVAELPGGGGKSSISVKGMAIGTAVAVSMLAQFDVPAEWTTETAGKMAMCGCKNASKVQMQHEAINKFPELRNMVPKSKDKRSKSGYEAWFEHSADAIAAFLAAQHGALIRYMAGDNGDYQNPDPTLF